MPELLIFIAPIFQIIFSILKITGVVNVPLWFIWGLTLFLGFILSFVAMTNVLNSMKGSGPRCGMPGMAFLFGGIFITLITSPIISLVFYLINGSMNKKEKAAN